LRLATTASSAPAAQSKTVVIAWSNWMEYVLLLDPEVAEKPAVPFNHPHFGLEADGEGLAPGDSGAVRPTTEGVGSAGIFRPTHLTGS
jgi:hypothetical protein